MRKHSKFEAAADLAADYNDIADLEVAEIARLDLSAIRGDDLEIDEMDDLSDYD